MSIIECPDSDFEAIIKRKGWCVKYETECYNRICRYWKNNTKLAYLAFAIDNNNGDFELVNKVINSMSRHLTIFNPKDAYICSNIVSLSDDIIRCINEFVIKNCDIFVAVWDPSIPSVGVPIEIDFALSLHIPTIIICGNIESAHKSVYFNSFIDKGAVVIPADNLGLLENILSMELSGNGKEE